MSFPKLPAVILAVLQEVCSVDLRIGKTAVGTLGSLSVVLALGDGAVIAVAPTASLNLVLQEEVEPPPLPIFTKVLLVNLRSIAVWEATFGTTQPGHLLDCLVILALALQGDVVDIHMNSMMDKFLKLTLFGLQWKKNWAMSKGK